MRILNPFMAHNDAAYELSKLLIKQSLEKKAGDAETSFGLAGRLYVSASGWLLLSVPNALGKGAFDALAEAGVELPESPEGRYNAHISVMRPEELELAGGLDKITERGHTFRYTLGRVKTAVPDGWEGVGRVWFIEVYSPELQTLRKSYGLSPLPRYPFHVTIGIRKTNVLRDNEISKTTRENT